MLDTISLGNVIYRIMYYGLTYQGYVLEIGIYRKREYPYVDGFTFFGDYSVSLNKPNQATAEIKKHLQTKRVQNLLKIYGVSI